MNTLAVARWQFGVTTVYHFLFVPLSIGLAFLVAGLQTAHHRSKDPRYGRLTSFFGKLFLINFAMGVATGLVQEFQFGMNWSAYSRFVGDIFGAPLAIEGLLAFFLESTFLGLWIFGRGRLSPRLHLATIWIAACGALLSAYFILAANSFMQNPVGYQFNAANARVELTDIAAVLTNPVAIATFAHTIAAAFLTAGAFVLGVGVWQLAVHPARDASAFRVAVKLGAAVCLVASLGVAATGDRQARVMTEVQPMKMAAAEALYGTRSHAGFSVFTIGTLGGQEELFSVRVPGLLSYLATGNPAATVEGIDDIGARYRAKYGPGDYAPNIPLTYWTFRWMIGAGIVAAAIAAWALWAIRGRRLPSGKAAIAAGVALPFIPLLGNSFGWIFTEMGRQPWIVFGLMPTASGVSPSAGLGEVLVSFIGFTLVYGALAVIELRLLITTIREGLPVLPSPSDEDAAGTESGSAGSAAAGNRRLDFAY